MKILTLYSSFTKELLLIYELNQPVCFQRFAALKWKTSGNICRFADLYGDQ